MGDRLVLLGVASSAVNWTDEADEDIALFHRLKAVGKVGLLRIYRQRAYGRAYYIITETHECRVGLAQQTLRAIDTR